MMAFLEEFQHLKIQLEEIKSATGNFDNNNIIGKGGFGKVYKGVLTYSKGQSMVALKRLDRNSGQGDPEFLKEILMLSCYTHENLISLLGFCDEDGEKILVYEHAAYGSLDHHLNATTLTWRQRLKICLAAAKGLCYLHEPKGTQQRVIHRDIKSSNILLDENWNAKIADMGLSKIGPANLPHTFLATYVAGTPGYIDPLYMETYTLTKESDVYSFGVVLFEVLCGTLCFKYNNDHFQNLVPTWKQSYEEKTLNEIIYHELKQLMDPSSLEIFSEIANQCLHKSRAERPKMSTVVEKLEIALQFQEDSEEVEPSIDYEEMIKTVVPLLVYGSKQELKLLLSKGILLKGTTWFRLNKNGEHCEMISAAKCLIPIHSLSPEDVKFGPKKSRFGVHYKNPLCLKFKIHVRAQFLSPRVTYVVNLVFRFVHNRKYYFGIHYMLAGETIPLTCYLTDEREDGWFVAELYHFTSRKTNINLEIMFECQVPLLIDGVEFHPLDKVELEGQLEDEDVDMETISCPDTYWEQKLPSDYEDIIKRSKDSVEWTTKKELYSILCKGFPIKEGEENSIIPQKILTRLHCYTFIDHQWFSLAKNGKKCRMIPARMTLVKPEWTWGSLLESRFEEVAFNPCGSFWICFEPKMLSPDTTYASYLVYKLHESHSGCEPPLEVSDVSKNNDPWYIYLLTPLTPIIGRKVNRDTHNLFSRPKRKGLPQQRKDGWMEVQVSEFRTGTATEEITKFLRLIRSSNILLKGLIVQGIEFKPL